MLKSPTQATNIAWPTPQGRVAPSCTLVDRVTHAKENCVSTSITIVMASQMLERIYHIPLWWDQRPSRFAVNLAWLWL